MNDVNKNTNEIKFKLNFSIVDYEQTNVSWIIYMVLGKMPPRKMAPRKMLRKIAPGNLLPRKNSPWKIAPR